MQHSHLALSGRSRPKSSLRDGGFHPERGFQCLVGKKPDFSVQTLATSRLSFRMAQRGPRARHARLPTAATPPPAEIVAPEVMTSSTKSTHRSFTNATSRAAMDPSTAQASLPPGQSAQFDRFRLDERLSRPGERELPFDRHCEFVRQAHPTLGVPCRIRRDCNDDVGMLKHECLFQDVAAEVTAGRLKDDPAFLLIARWILGFTKQAAPRKPAPLTSGVIRAAGPNT